MRYYALTKKGLERHFGGGSCRANLLKDWKDWYWQHVARYVVQDVDERVLTDGQLDIGWTDLSC